MSKITFAKFNEDIARKVLSKGATLPVANKILGNQKYLVQTKNKIRFGLDDFQFAGRPMRGRTRMYYSKDEILEDELIYPIAEMNDFNMRLGNELHYFRLFGYSIKDINYEPGKKIARVKFVQEDKISFEIAFLDLSDARHLHLGKGPDADRNLFILPQSKFTDDTELVALGKEQNVLLNLDMNDYMIVVASITDGQEFYETNMTSAPIFKTHSFLKKSGIFNKALFPDSSEAVQVEQFANHQLLEDDKNEQLMTNGFLIEDGRITQFSDENANLVVSEFDTFVLDKFENNFVMVNRYFDRRYQPAMNFQIDEILDDLTKKEFGTETLLEFQLNNFEEFKAANEEEEDESVDESTETDSNSNYDSAVADLFNKTQEDVTEQEESSKEIASEQSSEQNQNEQENIPESVQENSPEQVVESKADESTPVEQPELTNEESQEKFREVQKPMQPQFMTQQTFVNDKQLV